MTFDVKVKQWHAVATWTWNAGDDVCGICRMPFDGCPPDAKYPGDDSPVVWGVCTHAFHLQCINRSGRLGAGGSCGAAVGARRGPGGGRRAGGFVRQAGRRVGLISAASVTVSRLHYGLDSQ